jgi:hypothetical protein
MKRLGEPLLIFRRSVDSLTPHAEDNPLFRNVIRRVTEVDNSKDCPLG